VPVKISAIVAEVTALTAELESIGKIIHLAWWSTDVGRKTWCDVDGPILMCAPKMTF